MASWSNQIENRVLILGTAVVMIIFFWLFTKFFIVPIYESQISGLTEQIKINNELIRELANDPKYSIENDFGKTKAREGGTVVLDLNNNMTVKNEGQDSVKVSSSTDNNIQPKKKKSFWNIFKKKKK